MRSHRRNSVDPDHSHCRPGPACDNTRTGRIGQLGLTCAPPALPKVCWTGSSAGATIAQHPSSLARCRAQRSEQTASEGRRCARLLRHDGITAQMLSTPALPDTTLAGERRTHRKRGTSKTGITHGQTKHPRMAARGRPSWEVTELNNNRNPKPRSENRKSAVPNSR